MSIGSAGNEVEGMVEVEGLLGAVKVVGVEGMHGGSGGSKEG